MSGGVGLWSGTTGKLGRAWVVHGMVVWLFIGGGGSDLGDLEMTIFNRPTDKQRGREGGGGGEGLFMTPGPNDPHPVNARIAMPQTLSTLEMSQSLATLLMI